MTQADQPLFPTQPPRNKNTRALTQFIHEQLADIKAIKPCYINVEDISSVTDVMVIATGTSARHVKSIVNYLITECKKSAFKILSSEGQETGEWVLLDLGDVVVHIMQEHVRNFYELEKLWSTPLNEPEDFDEDDLLGREFEQNDAQ